MKALELDPVFSAALRPVLAETVEGEHRAHRRWRWRLGLGVFTGLTIVVGGVAVASGLFSPPGAPLDTPLGMIVSVTGSGSAVVDLGRPPVAANGVSLELTCLSAGTFRFPDGSYVMCSAADLGRPTSDRQALDVVPLTEGTDTVSIGASPSSSWMLRAFYLKRVSTPWGVNSRGETFGVPSQQGTPDLIAVVIDQGATNGYVGARQLKCASGGNIQTLAQALAWGARGWNVSIPVYESDGTTVIGTFVVGEASGSGVKVIPLSSLPTPC